MGVRLDKNQLLSDALAKHAKQARLAEIERARAEYESAKVELDRATKEVIRTKQQLADLEGRSHKARQTKAV